MDDPNPTFREWGLLKEVGYYDSGRTKQTLDEMGRRKTMAVLLPGWTDPDNGRDVLTVVVRWDNTQCLEYLLRNQSYKERLAMRSDIYLIALKLKHGSLDLIRILRKNKPTLYCLGRGHTNSCPSEITFRRGDLDLAVLLLKYRRDDRNNFRYCYHQDRSREEIDFEHKCYGLLSNRVRKAYAAFVVFLAMIKRKGTPDIYHYLFQPLLRELWIDYCVFPCWK